MKIKTSAIVLAAGRGSRMKTNVHKQFLLLGGKPILYYCLKTFEDSFIDEIVLVTGEGEIAYCHREIIEKYDFHKVKQIVAGGEERYHSVYLGLQAISECDYVFIHDGARPFITEEILEREYETVQRENACVIGMPVKDTIKLADESGYTVDTPRRDLLWMIQTPQIFSFDLVKRAYGDFLKKEKKIAEEGIQITDDAMVVEHFTNTSVKLVEGSYRNIKITTPEDLAIADIFLKNL